MKEGHMHSWAADYKASVILHLFYAHKKKQ